MFSTGKMVKKYVELLYNSTCDIFESKKIKNENGSTSFNFEKAYENIPCRVSYKSLQTSEYGGNGNFFSQQTVVIFLDPDIEIKSGSEFEIFQAGKNNRYVQCGIPAIYSSHQEVILQRKELN